MRSMAGVWAAALFVMGASGCTTMPAGSMKHIYVMVPAITGPADDLGIWKATHRSAWPLTPEFVRDRFCNMENVWTYFYEEAGLSLHLSPELRNVSARNRIYVEKMNQPDNGFSSEPFALELTSPYEIWRSTLRVDLSEEPLGPTFQYRLLAKYLKVLSEFYGTNVCVEGAVIPHFYHSPLRHEDHPVFQLRALDRKTIHSAHMAFLMRGLRIQEEAGLEPLLERDPHEADYARAIQKHRQEAEGEAAHTPHAILFPLSDDLTTNWRSWFSYMNGICGLRLQLVAVMEEQNMVVFEGTDEEVNLLEAVWQPT